MEIKAKKPARIIPVQTGGQAKDIEKIITFGVEAVAASVIRQMEIVHISSYALGVQELIQYIKDCDEESYLKLVKVLKDFMKQKLENATIIKDVF